MFYFSMKDKIYQKEMRDLLVTGGYIFVFAATSLAMSFFSFFLLSEDGYNFSLPLFLSSFSNLVHFLIALVLISFMDPAHPEPEQTLSSPIPYITREKIGSPVEESFREEKKHHIRSRIGEEGRVPTLFTRAYLFLKEIGSFNIWIILCSLNGSLDTGLSGYTLRVVPLAFYTMIKSSTPIFILLSRFLFQLEKPSPSLVMIILFIAAGVFFTSQNDSVVYRAGHIAMILGASFMAGFRWAFLEYFIKSNARSSSSILYCLCVISLLSGIFLCVGFAVFEGFSRLLAFEKFQTATSALLCFGVIAGAASFSFFLCMFEYIIIARTNVITLSVVGVAKELLIVGISVHRKKIVLSRMNVGGLGLALFGILMFIFRDRIFVPSTEKPEERKEPSEKEAYAESAASPIESSLESPQVLMEV